MEEFNFMYSFKNLRMKIPESLKYNNYMMEKN